MEHFLYLLLFIICWCVGGQFWKAARRFIISLALLAKKDKWNSRYLTGIALLSLVLSLGYGEDSFLGKVARKLFKSELLADSFVRGVYALFLFAVSVLIGGFSLFSAAILQVAFQIRSGSVKVGKYDLLFEDVYRSIALYAAIFQPWSLI